MTTANDLPPDPHDPVPEQDTPPPHVVTASYEDGLWVAEVDDLFGHTADAEHARDLPAAVTDLVAACTDTDPDQVRLVWRYRANGADVTGLLHEIHALADRLRELTARRDEVDRITEQTLRDAGLGDRQIFDLHSLFLRNRRNASLPGTEE